MKILVMGGTEFISRSVAEHFINENHEVDIFTRGKKEVPYTGYVQHFIGDRKIDTNLEQLENIPYEVVFDISAYTKKDVSLLLNHLDTSSLERYVFCSSGAVYKPSSEVMDESYPTGENHNWLQYGLDKLEAENYLFSLYHEKNLPITIFRPTYVYGPNNNLYRESYFFDRITQELPIPYPDSSSSTQFIHIHELVLILQSFLENPISIGEAYNVTHEQIYDFESVLNIFETVVNKPISKIKVHPTLYPSRRYFPYRDVTYMLSIEKLKRHHLYIPKFDLFAGLKQTYGWYQEKKPQLEDKNMTLVNEICKTKAK